MTYGWPILVALLVAQPLANEDVLEPSVENEVTHALARAPQEAATTQGDATRAEAVRPTQPKAFLSRAEKLYLHTFATNGLSATDRAIRLVSTQQADGRWRVGTNDVTRAAVMILKRTMATETNENSLPQ